MKLLFIRADAARHIGNGHVMRCLALALAWKAQGGRVLFVTHCDSDTLAKRIDAAGMERIALSASHPDATDLPQTLTLLAQYKPAWAVLDGYHFTPCYQEAMQEAMQETGGALLVMDDLAGLQRYHADLLVNQNVYADTLTYPCIGPTSLRLGASYALLRPEFARWQTWERAIPQTARNVLVTMGGTDPDNVTLKVMQALDSWRGREFEVKIVVGPGNPHADSLCRIITHSEHARTLIFAPDDMPSLMAWADIAVSAAGTTALELAYMRVPTLAVILADNQSRVALGLQAAHTLRNLGWHSSLTPQMLACALRQLAHSPNTRSEMAGAGRRLVDGLGAGRIISEMWESAC